jgi:hypothetical protein
MNPLWLNSIGKAPYSGLRYNNTPIPPIQGRRGPKKRKKAVTLRRAACRIKICLEEDAIYFDRALSSVLYGMFYFFERGSAMISEFGRGFFYGFYFIRVCPQPGS